MDPYQYPYNKYDVPQLLSVLQERDAEIAALKQHSLECRRKAEISEQRLALLETETHTLNDALRSMKTTIDDLVSELSQRCNELLLASQNNETLVNRVVSLQKHLDDHIFLRKGFFPFLGLEVAALANHGTASGSQQEHSDPSAPSVEGDSGASILSLREPAASSGLRPGDKIMEMELYKKYSIRNIDDFQQCIVDLLPDCTMTVKVSRGIGKNSISQYSFKPELLPNVVEPLPYPLE